jgi:hypothetical protein
MTAMQTRTLNGNKNIHPLLSVPRHDPLPLRRVSALREGTRIRKRGL